MSRGKGVQSDLRWVYQETKYKCKGQIVPPSTKYQISSLVACLPETRHPLSVKVQNRDCLELARELKLADPNKKVLVLNMASAFKPGGGVENGRTAQEEVIFRRSNAVLTHPVCWYPLKDRVIYSPEVTILRDSEYGWYKRGEQATVSMLAVSALRKPKLLRGGPTSGLHPPSTSSLRYTPEDRQEMQRRVDAIFQVALLEGQDVLVLGSLGCGAYSNPPQEVVELFRASLEKYGKYFREIYFAVLVVKDTDQENLDTFLSLAS